MQMEFKFELKLVFKICFRKTIKNSSFPSLVFGPKAHHRSCSLPPFHQATAHLPLSILLASGPLLSPFSLLGRLSSFSFARPSKASRSPAEPLLFLCLWQPTRVSYPVDCPGPHVRTPLPLARVRAGHLPEQRPRPPRFSPDLECRPSRTAP